MYWANGFSSSLVAKFQWRGKNRWQALRYQRKVFVFSHVQVEITVQHFGLHLLFGHSTTALLRSLVQTKAKPIPGLLQLQLWLCPLQRNERCAMPCPQKFPYIQQSDTTGSHKLPRGCPCVRTLQKSGQRTQERQKKNNLQYQQNG